jgi:hypothetical protein
MLTELFHDPQPDPEFLEGLEKRLLHPAKRPRLWETSRLGRFFGTLFASAPTLGWGAAAAVLVLALAWILGNLIPRPLTTIQPLLATPSATTGSPTMTATTAVTLEKQGTPLPVAAGSSTPAAPGKPSATPTAGISPTARPAGLYPGWSFYSNPAYGFSFSYPPGWQVEATGSHLIQLKQEPLKTLVFNIGFKRSSEDVGIQHTNTVSGSRTDAGSLYFLGQEISRQVVVEDGQEKAVFCNGGAEIRMKNGLLFTLAWWISGQAPLVLRSRRITRRWSTGWWPLPAPTGPVAGAGGLPGPAGLRPGRRPVDAGPSGDARALVTGGGPPAALVALRWLDRL